MRHLKRFTQLLILFLLIILIPSGSSVIPVPIPIPSVIDGVLVIHPSKLQTWHKNPWPDRDVEVRDE